MAAERIDSADDGSFEADEGVHVLEAAERHGYDWPFACRAGSCATCAAILVEGEMRTETHQILPQEEFDEKDVRLTCVGTPLSEHLRLVSNVKHIEYLRDRVI